MKKVYIRAEFEYGAVLWSKPDLVDSNDEEARQIIRGEPLPPDRYAALQVALLMVGKTLSNMKPAGRC